MTPSFQSTNTDVPYRFGNRSWTLKHDWIVYLVHDDTLQSNFQSAQHYAAKEPSEVSSATTVPPIVRTNDFVQVVDSDAARNRPFGTSAEGMLEHIANRFPSYPLVSLTTLPEFSLDRSRGRPVMTEVHRLFSLATFIDLEPGMANEFSEGLEEAIEKYGELALGAVESLVLNKETKPSIAMEALQYIGYTDSEKWHDERRRTIERCLLRSPSAWIRDGAGLGLASLDDPKSIPALEKAILNETSGALKEDLTLVLHQLRDTLREQ